MNELNDHELLKDYLKNGSETAFRELVTRHTNLVYSTAARLVIDLHLAKDVSQKVFIALAQNARKLADRPTLGGWLHRTTHNFSVMTIRTEERRRLREQKASPMLSTSNDTDSAWDTIAPDLDDALNQLSDADRDLIVLRFFQRKTAREIGANFGLGEEAAQKRVNRALEKLRACFPKRGAALSATILAGVISAQAVQAAPVGLASSLATSALLVNSTAPGFAGLLSKPAAFLARLKASPIAAGITIAACLTLGTTGFVTGKAAANRHWSTVAWRNAITETNSNEVAATPAIGTDPSAVAAAPSPARRQSVSEIFAEAAQFFRSSAADPDASSKGVAALQKLTPPDIAEALRQLDSFAGEPEVYRTMAPWVMKFWAQTDPHAALNYSITNLANPHPRGLALQLVSTVWASQEPEKAWAWFQQTSATGKLPIEGNSWRYIPTPIFTQWAVRDPAQAIAQASKAGATDEPGAFRGIALAAKVAPVRDGIVEAMNAMTDDERRNQLASNVAREWAKVDPEAAAEWGTGLTFQNPAGQLRVTSEAVQQWMRTDPHAGATWMLTKAPGELWDQFRNMMSPEQEQKFRNAAK